MKAIVYDRYGSPDVLRFEETEKPAPGDNEVVIEVRAASVNPLDWHFMRGTPYGMRFGMGFSKPKDRRLGTDVAGRVEAVGAKVTQLKPGDEVFGMCRGAFAEYVCTGESSLVIKPAKLQFEQAAAAPVGAITALQALRDKGKLQPGQKVLINGASGGVGTFAVQIARWLGADVTGVCSTRNVDSVRSIGAQAAIDYTQEDFTRGGQKYDVILDCIGNHSLSACRGALSRHGIYVIVGAPSGRWVAPMDRVLRAQVYSKFVSQELKLIMAKWSARDMTLMGELMEAGTVTAVIDRRYPLSEVPDAIRYLEEGHARGKVVITPEPDRINR